MMNIPPINGRMLKALSIHRLNKTPITPMGTVPRITSQPMRAALGDCPPPFANMEDRTIRMSLENTTRMAASVPA